MAPFLSDLVIALRDAFDGGDWERAAEIWIDLSTDLEQQDICEIWGYLDSTERAFLKHAPRKYLDDYYAQS